MTLLHPVLTALAIGFAALPAIADTAAAPKAGGATSQAAKADKPEVETLPDIVLGQADAPLTIYEYASFTCRHCADFHDKKWPKLKSEYIDTGKVRFVQRDVYFDMVSLWAGVLARCGDDAKYSAVSDMLYDEQDKWLDAKNDAEISANLRKIGAKAGMTTQQMDACWNDRDKVYQLIATFKKNYTEHAVYATPTLIIGGEKVHNQEWDALKKIIDDKLEAIEKS